MSIDPMSAAKISRIGIAGLGLMGQACADRLGQAGFDLVGFDVDPARCRAFRGPGREAAASLAALVACDAVVLAVFDTAQVEAVIEGDGGLLVAGRVAGDAAQPLPLVLCISTCDPDRIAALATRCAAAGLPFVEMPISGTSRTLAAGDAMGLVAGHEADVAQAQPVLDALCGHRHFLGSAGNAGRAKLAVNLVLGLNRAAMAEGLVLAEQLGLAAEPFLKVLQDSAASSRVMSVKGQMMARRHFDPPQSKVAQSLKDFHLIIDQAAARGQALPFAQTYAAMMSDCLAHGDAERDNALIVEAIARQRVSR
jgi:3-hydroxyisobutyrate dehydrogenase-like beta-hydroxyacid dehydrogenase